MNISKHEQRTLHALAASRIASHPWCEAWIRLDSRMQITLRVIWRGRIEQHKDDRGDIIAVDCITREGCRLDDCTLSVFRKLRKRRLIRSENGAPYRVTREGLDAVRAQVDNRA